MAKFKPAANFRKPAGSTAKRPAAKKSGSKGKGNAWTAYVGGGKGGGRKYDAIPD